MSDYVRATEYFQKTLELDPDDRYAESMLEIIQEKQN